MDFVIELFKNAVGQTLLSLSHNWPFLLASIAIAGALKAFVDAQKVSAFLNRFRGASVLAATLAAVATPLCSCGTMAVVLGMMASTMPWAPIVAFMVASPLSSPEGIVYSAGIFGWPFAVYYFVVSIVLGLVGGFLAAVLQKAGFLRGQARYSDSGSRKASCSCSGQSATAASTIEPRFVPKASQARVAPLAAAVLSTGDHGCGCAKAVAAPSEKSGSDIFGMARTLGIATWDVTKTILPMFIGFAFLGYLLNGLIPATAISTLFGTGKFYGVPLAATIGIPLYVNSEGAMPLVRALLDSGMSQGAVMAFLIAGSGTSVGAIAGALTIARWRIVGLVVGTLWVGAIAAGYGYNALLALGLL